MSLYISRGQRFSPVVLVGHSAPMAVVLATAILGCQPQPVPEVGDVRDDANVGSTFVVSSVAVSDPENSMTNASVDVGSDTTDESMTTATESSNTELPQTETTESTGKYTPEPLGPLETPGLVSPLAEVSDATSRLQLCWDIDEAADSRDINFLVYVNGIELGEGVLNNDGFEKECTQPLDFLPGRTYDWSVIAFDEDDPTNTSLESEVWSFTVLDEGDSKLIYEEGFETDSGWVVESTSGTGGWIRGFPQEVKSDGRLRQVGDCHNHTENCYYTGVGSESVNHSTVRLTSPPIDMSDYSGITVALWRFFSRDSYVAEGSSLAVELLVPSDDGEGYDSQLLDSIDNSTEARDANAWTPIAYALCGMPLVEGAKIRIVASDSLGAGVEAAIDDIQIWGHNDFDNCADTERSLCDPSASGACADGLLCCATGPLVDGIHRCAPPVQSIGDTPPATPDGEMTGALGCELPDLHPVKQNIDATEEWVFVEADSCTVYEGCVDGEGWRKLLKFNMTTQNVGATDLVMGVVANRPDVFAFSECHRHFHFTDFAKYELHQDQTVAAVGHKQASCLVDYNSWAWTDDPTNDGGPNYSCKNQGLTLGWQDVYKKTLDCQWIDVTDISPGFYTLFTEVNYIPYGQSTPTLVELDYSNNIVESTVEITDLALPGAL